MRRPPTYPKKLWNRAEGLVVQQGLTLEKAAKRVGIPLGTLKPRAAREGWVKLREAREDYAGRVHTLKVKALQVAIGAPSKENIDAWAVIERAYPEKTYGEEAQRLEQVIESFEGFALWLTQRDPSAQFLEELSTYTAEYINHLEG